MLRGLCGNQNIQKILLFLFVNRSCYGKQIERLLDTPLTTIQHALSRLEKGKIITSSVQGKTRIYQFNVENPLLLEIEQLLQKTYTLLPPHEKKLYARAQLETEKKGGSKPALVAFWGQLKRVSTFTRSSSSRSGQETGWSGKGDGMVLVTQPSEHVILFSEKGTWQGEKGSKMTFTNVFRWTLDLYGGMVGLEHLRLGPNNPVFLFYLTPDASLPGLSSVGSHLCELDAYFATASWDSSGIRLKWRVIGLKKNEEMEYIYKSRN